MYQTLFTCCDNIDRQLLATEIFHIHIRGQFTCCAVNREYIYRSSDDVVHNSGVIRRQIFSLHVAIHEDTNNGGCNVAK